MVVLSEEQKRIMDIPGNLAVLAGAGTGKTLTISCKVEKDLSDYHTFKTIAAITFTVKAANELRQRIRFDTRNCFIGTINRFALNEIIQPFAKDVWRELSGVNFTTDYMHKFNSFEECFKHFKTNHEICTAKNERNKNFIFELAHFILKKSSVARMYLKSRYFKIFIDEYQDCDCSMHKLFEFICKQLHITLVIAGDVKQSIYAWRGADPSLFALFWHDSDFEHIQLKDNFRSCQAIQNYTNLLNKQTASLYKKNTKNNEILLIHANRSNWITKVLPYLSNNGKIALLRYKNSDIDENVEELSTNHICFERIKRPPVFDTSNGTAWLYIAIAEFLVLNQYTIYDFIAQFPYDVGDKHELFQHINRYLNLIKDAFVTRDFQVLIYWVQQLGKELGIEISDGDLKKLICTVANKEYYSSFSMEDYQRVSMTFFSAKGLGFDQVILFANDYPLDNEASINNHYVATTRAKSQLIIVLLDEESTSRQYMENICRLFGSHAVQLSEIVNEV